MWCDKWGKTLLWFHSNNIIIPIIWNKQINKSLILYEKWIFKHLLADIFIIKLWMSGGNKKVHIREQICS